jgi:cytochrome c2
MEVTNMSRRFAAAVILLAGIAPVGQALAQDAEAGKKVFAKCAVCHGIGDAKKPLGPTLNGVIGRTAGTEPDFLAKASGYSKAMKEAGAGGLVWDETTIGEYIADPKGKIPGNKMAFVGLKVEKDRADVIAYIKTFSN